MIYSERLGEYILREEKLILDDGSKIDSEAVLGIMKKYGISQYKLGTITGVSRRQIVNVLTGSKNTTYFALYQIAKLMDIEISDLLKK